MQQLLTQQNGSSYSVQGSNITASTMGGLSAQTGATAAAGHTDGSLRCEPRAGVCFQPN